MKRIPITFVSFGLLLSFASNFAQPPSQEYFGDRQMAMKTNRLLKREVDTTPLKQFPTVKFKDLLGWTESKCPKLKGKIRFDKNAYAVNIRRRLLESEASFLDFPDRMEIGDVLRVALFTRSTTNATFVIHNDGIEITPRFRQLEAPVLRVYPTGLNLPARQESFYEARLRETREFAKNLLSP